MKAIEVCLPCEILISKHTPHGKNTVTSLFKITPFFFVITPGSSLLYLDPHTTQQAVNPEKMSQIPDEVFKIDLFAQNIIWSTKDIFRVRNTGF